MQPVEPSRQENVRAALLKARALLEECRVRSIPVDLARLAKQVGIQRVTELDTCLDGQLLELAAGQYEVILSKSAPVARKRFTLAHEIGHLLLFPQEAACHLDLETEELCNVAASELLIPSLFLAKMFPAGQAVNLQALLRVPRLFRCSLEAAGWKLLNSGFVSGALLIWRIAEPEECLELVAVPHTWGAQKIVNQGLRVYPGDWLWRAVMSAESGTIRLPSMLEGMCYSGEFVRLRKIVLFLVESDLHRLGGEESRDGYPQLLGKRQPTAENNPRLRRVKTT